MIIKQFAILIFSLFIASHLTGCASCVRETNEIINQQYSGNLKVHLIYPVSNDISETKITYTQGSTVKEMTVTSSATLELTPGPWSLLAECFTSANHLIARATSSGEIAAGTVSSVTLNIQLLYSPMGQTGSGQGEFYYPYALTATPAGIYIADTYNHRIQVLTTAGQFVRKWGSHGAQEGQFSFPVGIAADPSGNIYVTEKGNFRVQKFDSTGHSLEAWGGFGTANGLFLEPGGIAVDSQYNVFVVDRKNPSISCFDRYGNFIRRFGDIGDKLVDPVAVAVSQNDEILVSDSGRDEVLVFTKTGTLLRTFGKPKMKGPAGLCVVGSAVYVVNEALHAIQKWMLDGTWMSSQIESDTNVATGIMPFDVVPVGSDLWVTDRANNRIIVLKTD